MMKYLAVILLPVFLFLGCVGPEPKPVAEPVAVAIPPAPEPEPMVLPKTPFTSKMIQMFQLSSAEICDLQFYISHDIELQKRVPAQTSSISNGTLMVNIQDKIKKIIIKKDTPCIAIKAEDNLIVVKFNNTLELIFMHSPTKKDLFFLSAQKWEKGVGSIMIEDKMYQAVGTSGQAYLQINKTDVDNSDQNATVIEGEILE